MSPPLRIAVLHYHLRRGGVSRVIEHARNALPSEDFRMAIIVGEAPESAGGLDLAVVDGLQYGADSEKTGAMLCELRSTAKNVLGGPPDIWHVHNHSLGKNLTLPRIIETLAADGERILLQPHDFAEDSRPANYRYLRQGLGESTFEKLYPFSRRIHYAVLTRRDRDLLATAGSPDDCLHILPNPAPPPIAASGNEHYKALENMIVYPSRAIRRKNLGELLLWATLDLERHRYGITLAPLNPKEKELYSQWVGMAKELELPIEFELGSQYPFGAILSSAAAAITCSLAEGYGMAFIEPWMSGCALLGRKLPEITAGFEQIGIDLSHCYQRLDLPVELLGRERIAARLQAARAEMLSHYQRRPDQSDLEQVLASAIVEDQVDFGALDSELQSDILRRISSSGELRTELGRELPLATARARIEGNRETIGNGLSLERYRMLLEDIYSELMAAPRDQCKHLRPSDLLDRFLDPSRFRALLA